MGKINEKSKKYFFTVCLVNTLVLSDLAVAKVEVKTLSNLSIIELKEGSQYYENLPGWDKNGTTLDAKIANVCSGKTLYIEKEKITPLAGGIVAILISPIINLLLGSIDQSLENELKKYSTSYDDKLAGNFYQIAEDGTIEPLWNCFRFTRILETINTKKDQIVSFDRNVEMDLIVQMRVNNDIPAMQFRPLRLFFGKSAAKGDKIGLAVGISADGVWLSENVGHSRSLFDHLLLKTKVESRKNETEGAVQHFCETIIDKKTLKKRECMADSDFLNWESRSVEPLMPWSSNKTAADAFGTLKISVSEVGDSKTKKVLTVVKKIYGEAKKELGSVLSEAAKSLVVPESPAPTTPETFTGSCVANPSGFDCEWVEKTDDT